MININLNKKTYAHKDELVKYLNEHIAYFDMTTEYEIYQDLDMDCNWVFDEEDENSGIAYKIFTLIGNFVEERGI